MRKRALAACLAVLLVCTLVPAAGAAVSRENAQAYLNAMNAQPEAKPCLVDFDGDGTEELLLMEQKRSGDPSYAVWQGTRLMCQEDDQDEYSTYLVLGKKGGQYYLASQVMAADIARGSISTLSDGQWVVVEDMFGYYYFEGTEGKWKYTRNGKVITKAEYDAVWACYAWEEPLTLDWSAAGVQAQREAVEKDLLAALDTPSDSYQDVLNDLSDDQKKALFNDFLPLFSGWDVDYRTISDADLAQLMSDVWYDPEVRFPLLQSLPHTSFYDDIHSDVGYAKEDIDQVTMQLFGRTLDFSKLKNLSSLPDLWADGNFCYVYQGMFCFHFGGGGHTGNGHVYYLPQHLYDLGNGYYAAVFVEQLRLDMIQGDYLKWTVVKKKDDGTYRYVRSYPSQYVPTNAELAAFTKPSSWAQAEISAAQAAGLIPALVNDPCWQSKATRLHFAQLAVRLAETATGETLPAAPASTFTDCTDLAVRKAYAAGIVNGTTSTTFSPQNKLTREQLATMLWRAVDYIQTQTGEDTLTAGGSLTGYTDAGQVSAYAQEAVAALAHHSIMQGTGPTTLSPKNDCTVEQSVILAYRTLEKLG